MWWCLEVWWLCFLSASSSCSSDGWCTCLTKHGLSALSLLLFIIKNLWQLVRHTLLNLMHRRNHWYGMNGDWIWTNCRIIIYVGLNDFPSTKNSGDQRVTSHRSQNVTSSICAEMDWWVGLSSELSRQRWLLYAYDEHREVVVAYSIGDFFLGDAGRLIRPLVHLWRW